MNQNNATKLYDAKLSQQVDYCMNAAAEYYSRCLTSDDPFLLERGISYETAQRFHVGRAKGKTNLLKHLYELRISTDIVSQCGLLNKHGNDLFQNHVVFPIYLGDQAVDFIGRYTGDNSDYPKYWRLPRERVSTGHSHFNWDINRSEVILVEGVMDALSLIQNGFDNTAATGGTNGLNENLLRRSIALGLKKVWICFDGDDAGRKRGLVLAFKLADLGLKVKMVTLPDGQDPNDFFLTNSAEDFNELLRSAAIPEQWAISLVPDELDAQAKVETLEEVMTRIGSLTPLTKAPLVELISKKVGQSKKEVNEHLALLAKQATKEIKMDFKEYEEIHPALHFGYDETLVTCPFLGNEGWESWVITSNREAFPLSQDELRKRGYCCKSIVKTEKQQFSPQVVKEFLSGRQSDDLVNVFIRIKDTLKNYCDFPEQSTYDYLSIWIIGTYFFPVFNYYPYLHFTGTKETGKSKTIKLMSLLCWNGKMSVSMTDASMFRIISQLLPTLFLDESENLSDKTPSDRRALLLGGFEKGASVPRTESINGEFRVVEYDNYCPRVFGSINRMDDTLASRSVQIAMSRSYDDRIKENEVMLEDPRFKDIKDTLFLALMTYGNSVRMEYEQCQRPHAVKFDAREWNLFKPLYAIAAIVGCSDSLVEFANARYEAKTEAMNDTAVENVVLRYMLETVQQENDYVLDKLHDGLIAFIKENDLDLGFGLTKEHFGTILHHLRIIKSKSRKMMCGKRQTVYRIEPETLKRVALNYRVEITSEYYETLPRSATLCHG